MKIGFDNEKYVSLQSERIKERIAQFGNKLYLELGGKLFDDHHASRVLPGFEPDSKLKMLQKLSASAEIIIVISAIDIEKNKIRNDLGITYDEDVLRLREEFMHRGFLVSGVVITHYNGQNSADMYREKLDSMGIKTYMHYTIEGYPHAVDVIDSEQGFGKNEYVVTKQPLVIVTAPGPGSGKMAVCLSQLYQEHMRGVAAGYAKFETFPVWNLALKNPVNVAYEAATADIGDMNMVDAFHYEAYDTIAINYNRDIEIFPVLTALFEGIYGESPYKSPTDMGVNVIADCICDDEVCREAAKHEIIRRYFTALNKMAQGEMNQKEVSRIARTMKVAKISVEYRKVVTAARQRKEDSQLASSAIELEDGTIITASEGELLGSSAALLLNASKHLAGIDHAKKLIPQNMIEPIQKTKTEYLKGRNPRLHADEVLIALSVLSQHDENCKAALAALPQLRNCQMHSTVMMSEVDLKIFGKLGIGLTCDPVDAKSQKNDEE